MNDVERDYIRRLKVFQHVPELLGYLTVYDFGATSVEIKFEDGSNIFFKYAFYRRENDFIVVYTEHCDYHIFQLTGDDKIIGEEWPYDRRPDKRGEEYWYFDKFPKRLTND